ncbi:MAG: hypothetical protein IPK16_00155 [Anaerolineales bacterium]|nr:hypothetical protein [Anaerolineales bacterium]
MYFLAQQLQWGLGWALGFVAGAGVLYATFAAVRTFYRLITTWVAIAKRRATRRWLDDAELANLVVWAWVLPYFGLTGAFLAKFNRYMSPLLPFVLLWAAWLIVVLWRTGRTTQGVGVAIAAAPAATATPEVELVPPAAEAPATPEGEVDPPVAAPAETVPPPATKPKPWFGTLAHWAAAILAVLGVAGGLFWSLAYVNGVYNREHTWITASRWIYENVPEGSQILWELWDDPLPKAIPGEPGMDMGSQGLNNIDWSPYEEDTAEKYEILKQKLREADYVAYSSKRIYDSVDELPARYPMTNLYYTAMRDGRLGFELAGEFTSPPQLFGLSFDDRSADESWSLYDHPQVSVFRKERDLTDAEFDALFDRAWETATPYYRGPDSPLSPFLNFIGLGNQPGSESSGILNAIIGLFSTTPSSPVPPPDQRKPLTFDTPIQQLPIVDNYRWNPWASNNTVLAILWWWLVLALLGWLVWPMAFITFAPLRDRGFFLSRTLGWLLGGWVLWMLINVGVLRNFVTHAWLSVAIIAAPGIYFGVRRRRELWEFMRSHWAMLVAGELVFALAFLFFIAIRVLNPDLCPPWFGGEKQMEFAFLNGILRSPSFPPVNPHFAGGYINYYYFGLYLVAYLIKLTGIYAEVAFNLTIATLFALTVMNTFTVAYSAIKGHSPLSLRSSALPWTAGFGAALLAPLFVTVIGNLDGFAQVIRNLANVSPGSFQSAIPGLKALVDAVGSAPMVLSKQVELPPYDFWGPSRVVVPTINEFPYWSFLFADLHPHIIGIPLAAMFMALTLVLIEDANTDWRKRWKYGLGLLGVFALFLGSLAAVNLWELPTYFGLGVLAFVISQFRGRGRVDWLITLGVAIVYPVGAYLLYWPFFRSYVNVGASGIGLLREPDPPGLWLLVWGFLLFMFLSWLLFAATRPARPLLDDAGHRLDKPSGIERAVSLFMRQYDRLPRALHLHGSLVRGPTFFYLLLLALIPFTAALAVGAGLLQWWVLALCLLPLGLAFALLWHRGREADAGSLFASMCAATGLALLAGTQIFYMKDFLDGSEYYRMNTLFKFFNQAWVFWAMMAAVALPRILDEWLLPTRAARRTGPLIWLAKAGWSTAFVLLLAASLAFPILGTPARLKERMPGWQPELGTLNGMEFMRQGIYAWPDYSNVIDLSYESQAIEWLLDNIRGNATIVESSEVDYYRAFGTKVSSNTGLSGLKGMHEQEQRYPEDVGYRDGLYREFWSTVDIPRTEQIVDELEIDLIYVGQLERFLHPDAVRKLEQMAATGQVESIYQSDRVTIYAIPGRLVKNAAGQYQPVQGKS